MKRTAFVFLILAGCSQNSPSPDAPGAGKPFVTTTIYKDCSISKIEAAFAVCRPDSRLRNYMLGWADERGIFSPVSYLRVEIARRYHLRAEQTECLDHQLCEPTKDPNVVQ